MDKPQIIGIGIEGLIGSRIRELLKNEFDFISLGISQGVNVTNPATLVRIKDYKESNFVLHLAAKTDVDSCEKDKHLKEAGASWKINVEGAKNVAEICREMGKKIIYFSTDIIFDGKKPEGQSYSEEDQPNPINWYGETKYQGEIEIEQSGADYIILRTAYPYRASFKEKKDFFRNIKDNLEEDKKIKTIVDQFFCPTFIDDIAAAVKTLVINDSMGIYHVVGSEPITPFGAAQRIAEEFGLERGLISKTTREQFFKNRAPRPFNSSLRNDKIAKLGVYMRGFEEGLREIKKQLSDYKL